MCLGGRDHHGHVLHERGVSGEEQRPGHDVSPSAGVLPQWPHGGGHRQERHSHGQRRRGLLRNGLLRLEYVSMPNIPIASPHTPLILLLLLLLRSSDCIATVNGGQVVICGLSDGHVYGLLINGIPVFDL